MTRLPREPLDADERALASRLPRLHGREEPDAAVDARILAAAHAAVSPATPGTRRRGWIVPLTAAASVSLAVGLAWQLQPPPAQTPPPASSPTAAVVEATNVGAAGAAHATEAAPIREQDIKPQGMPSPATEAAPAGDVARIAPEATPAQPAVESRAAAPMFVPPPSSAPVAEDMEVVSAPPPTPPAPPVPAAATPQSARARSAAADIGASAAGAVEPAQAKRTRDEAGAAASADAAPSEQFAEAIDEEDVPPATMDAPAARDAWLRRIGELQQQGRIDDAKASLAEFRRRYPDAVLPVELRKLEP